MNGPSCAEPATPVDADASTARRCLVAINRPLDWLLHAGADTRQTVGVNCTRGPLLWRHSSNLTADTRTHSRVEEFDAEKFNSLATATTQQ